LAAVATIMVLSLDLEQDSNNRNAIV
jgi:hypothetical protein